MGNNLGRALRREPWALDNGDEVTLVDGRAGELSSVCARRRHQREGGMLHLDALSCRYPTNTNVVLTAGYDHQGYPTGTSTRAGSVELAKKRNDHLANKACFPPIPSILGLMCSYVV